MSEPDKASIWMQRVFCIGAILGCFYLGGAAIWRKYKRAQEDAYWDTRWEKVKKERKESTKDDQ